MKPENIKVDKLYRGHRRRKLWNGEYDDRVIVWVSSDMSMVQYDSYSVGVGRYYPETTMEKFLKWAKEEVTQPDNAPDTKSRAGD